MNIIVVVVFVSIKNKNKDLLKTLNRVYKDRKTINLALAMQLPIFFLQRIL